MRRTILLVLFCLLLMSVRAYAVEEEQSGAEKDTGQLSEEEQQLLAVLELLQNFDLLEEIEVLSAMEEEQ